MLQSRLQYNGSLVDIGRAWLDAGGGHRASAYGARKMQSQTTSSNWAWEFTTMSQPLNAYLPDAMWKASMVGLRD